MVPPPPPAANNLFCPRESWVQKRQGHLNQAIWDDAKHAAARLQWWDVAKPMKVKVLPCKFVEIRAESGWYDGSRTQPKQ